MLAGLTFIAFGLFFAISAATYDIGTTLQMGPGYVPLLLGVLLVVLGGIIVARGFVDGEPGEIGHVPWRAALLILGAVVLFGVTVRGLGLVPATFASAFLAASASRLNTVLSSVAVAVGLTVISVLVFVVALGLRLPLVGPLLGG